ncbi:hypothetical protein PHMEG_00025353 [Phytophthora megakarya]|uniref:Peptidase S33 tripeptidyl aminopeptidase-like C-terminal domain-containing protein n=1 Tax=Phytophthora megakarya TaxID=4795 RepID=A0A225VES4_9STRA|nr:hypothetical protein PHMEG_00025353 [Phytophthora megakarya]
MQLYQFTLAVILLPIIGAAKVKKPVLNGWYPCADNTFSDGGSSDDQSAECATFRAPLCYPGICETPQFANPTVNIFVKRILATKGDPKTASNVWFLQGGPGEASTDLEIMMTTLYTELKATVNVYTMDHRGTGRSTVLDCVAAQATTTGSPFGSEVKPSEVPACAQALETEYGDLASFSITSAATDLTTFISNFTNGASTTVYGVSYGTVLVERVMHLNPPEVTGYVLDGVATTSGASADKFEYLSNWDAYFGEVGEHFLSLCKIDASCNAYFKKPNTLRKTLQKVLTSIDKHPNSTFAAMMNELVAPVPNAPPSKKIKSMLGEMLQDEQSRKLIPPLIYRLNRREDRDVEFVKLCVAIAQKSAQNRDEGTVFASNLLYHLIVFSEMWEHPQPSMSVMKSRFNNYGISYGTYWMPTWYCAFSKEKSPVCDKLGYGNYPANGIIYERDEYWNKSATIPSQASVLIMSSKLDAQTPHKYAEYLLEALDGDKKKLITFEYATHGTLMTTSLNSEDPSGSTCGVKILASYVKNDGDLNALDKSCVKKMPAFSLKILGNYTTYDAYEKAYSPEDQGKST